MRNKLEFRLSHLSAPDAPRDLKARCLQTIPVATQHSAPKSRGWLRPSVGPKLGLAALVIVTGVSIAFWNTRPMLDKTLNANGSAAFAQTLAAMENVTYCHSNFWRTNTESKDGWNSTKRLTLKGVFDLSRGAYWEEDSQAVLKAGPQPAPGDSLLKRTLVLPDGTAYYRYANSLELTIKHQPEVWQGIKQGYVKLISGTDALAVSHATSINTDEKPQLLSSASGNWQGKTVDIYLFRAGWSAKRLGTTKRGAAAIKTKFFVDPRTHFIVCRQAFVVFTNGTERQVEQVELDYSRPDATDFDPARLKIGARIHDQRTQKTATSSRR